MATSSNSYLFGTNTQLDDLFREAFERIGIIGNDQTPLHIQSAIMSGNLELSSWPGRGLNLWLVQQQMFSIYVGQPTYSLPLNTVRVLEVVATQPVRLNSGGTPGSTFGGTVSGNPGNCFSPTQNVGYTQSVANGNISYDYGVDNAYSILYVGITPLANSSYTLSIEYSFDNVNWTTVYQAPAQNYQAYQITWFVIQQSLNARAWRIRETGGAILAIQQIYFDQATTYGTGDRQLTNLSRSEYIAIPTKLTQGFPSGYYFNQIIQPTITLWPTPPVNNTQTNILYTNYSYAQDVTQMFQTVQVPQRFYDAFVAGLTARLAMKFATDKFDVMNNEAKQSYAIAAKTDFENVTMRFQPDFTSYSG